MNRWVWTTTPGKSSRFAITSSSIHVRLAALIKARRAVIVGFVVSQLFLLGLPLSVVAQATADTSTTETIEPPETQPILGERLEFQGRWMGIPVGYGWIEVKELTEVDGRQVYHIEAQGHSNEVLSTFYPIHDVVHSYLDAKTLKPLRFEKYQREGRYRADEIVTFNYATSTAMYHSLLNQSTKDIPLTADVQDLASMLYWFRAQPVQPNSTVVATIYTDEKLYVTRIHVKQVVSLELLKRGTFPCVIVEPTASFKGLLIKRGRIWAYFTTDPSRLPLLVKATTPWGPMSAVLEPKSLSDTRHRSHTDWILSF